MLAGLLVCGSCLSGAMTSRHTDCLCGCPFVVVLLQCPARAPWAARRIRGQASAAAQNVQRGGGRNRVHDARGPQAGSTSVQVPPRDRLGSEMVMGTGGDHGQNAYRVSVSSSGLGHARSWRMHGLGQWARWSTLQTRMSPLGREYVWVATHWDLVAATDRLAVVPVGRAARPIRCSARRCPKWGVWLGYDAAVGLPEWQKVMPNLCQTSCRWVQVLASDRS